MHQEFAAQGFQVKPLDRMSPDDFSRLQAVYRTFEARQLLQAALDSGIDPTHPEYSVAGGFDATDPYSRPEPATPATLPDISPGHPAALGWIVWSGGLAVAFLWRTCKGRWFQR